MSKASSNAITSSTVSSESAPRSSTNDALGVTSPSSTPSCSTMICLTFSSTAAIRVPRSCGMGLPPLLLRYFGIFLDVADCVLHGFDLFGLIIGDLEVESFLEGHDEFHPIEGVGAEIVHERSAGRDLALFHAELVDDDLLDFVFYPGHADSSCMREMHATNLSVYMSVGKAGKADVDVSSGQSKYPKMLRYARYS